MDTEAQHTWLLKSHNYRFVVEYKKGRDNVAADGLSRREEANESNFLMITAVETDWVDQVRTRVQTDDYFHNINTKWEQGTLDPKVYHKRDGQFYYKNTILLSPSSPLNQLITSELHDTLTGRHSGYEKTLQRVKKII